MFMDVLECSFEFYRVVQVCVFCMLKTKTTRSGLEEGRDASRLSQFGHGKGWGSQHVVHLSRRVAKNKFCR